MKKEEYEKLSKNMQVAFEHETGSWTENENGNFSVDIRPSNSEWEDFCNKNVEYIDSFKDVDEIRNLRMVFDHAFGCGFGFAKRWFGV